MNKPSNGNMGKKLNIEYGGIWALYWMYYAIINSFSSVFLLDRGYSNHTIGIVLAVANILAAVVQTPLADIVDNSQKMTLHRMLKITGLIALAAAAGLVVFNEKSPELLVIYVLIITIIVLLQGFINSMDLTLMDTGHLIDFGIDRAAGSFGYALIAIAMGVIVEKFSPDILPITGFVTLLLYVLLIYLNHLHFKKAMKERHLKSGGCSLEHKSKEENYKPISLGKFLKRNKMFVAMCLGVTTIYFGNSVVNNFLLQIVEPLGGDSKDMGGIFALAAILEIPAFIVSNRLYKRFGSRALLKLAAICFTIKILIYCIAKSVLMVYLAQLMQMFSYVLFLASAVYFINEIMEKREAVKGQTWIVTMMTVGSVLASFFGGFILDISGAKVLIIISTILSAIGTAIILLTVDKVKNHKKSEAVGS